MNTQGKEARSKITTLVVIVILCIVMLALALFLLTKSVLFIGATLLIFALSSYAVFSVSSLTRKLKTPHSSDELSLLPYPEREKVLTRLAFVAWTSISLGAVSFVLLIAGIMYLI